MSRIGFHLVLWIILWGANRLVPDFDRLEAQKWEAKGVARPYFAVPLSEWEKNIIRQSR